MLALRPPLLRLRVVEISKGSSFDFGALKFAEQQIDDQAPERHTCSESA